MGEPQPPDEQEVHLPEPGLGDPATIKILSYDRIVMKREPTGGRWDVSESAFIRQMELLDAWGYKTVTFEDVWLYEEGKLNLPLKPIVLTFNGADGIVYQREFSFLHSLGMRAVVFALGDHPSDEHRGEQLQAGFPPLMSERQMLELLDFGFEIGSMGISGKNLTEVDRDAAWQEISRSRMTLEALLNVPVTSFAYPHGAVNDEVKQLVAEAGYRLGCSLHSGPHKFGADPYEVRRIIAPDTASPSRFFLALHSVPFFS